MHPTQLNSFVEKTENYLRAVRSGILLAWQEGSSSQLSIQINAVRGLVEEASRYQFGGLTSVLAAIEAESRQSFGPNGGLQERSARTLLDLIAAAEAEVVKLRFSTDDAAIDVGSFVDESFGAFQLDSLLSAEPESGEIAHKADDAEEDEFEPDAEMLEIFAMEAEDLLTNIETNLESLKASPADRDALWEVRRHAHTFKGAAGIIGLKKPSALAHRIEDLLDHLSQNDISPTARVLELITEASICLRAITAPGDGSTAMEGRVTAVYAGFEEVLAGLSQGTAAKASPAAAEVPLPAEPALPTPGEARLAVPAEASAPRPIVRVSIARLDELVRISRDLVVSRSVMERYIGDLETQLEALSATTRRLQAATARIENNFEASMLGTQMQASFARPGWNELEQGEPETEAEEFDALELDRYTEFHESSRALAEATQDCFGIATALESLKGTLESAFDDQRRLIEETQEKVMQIRLIKFGSLSTRIQRAVRVTCEEEHKNAEVFIENEDVELDTDVLDSLVEPLMHLIRNAVVHGIEPADTRRLLGKSETGRIVVSVNNEETHVELKVRDDGRGISPAALRDRAIAAGLITPAAAEQLDENGSISLMFLPGLTTADKLTMSAGRGVGMSIVKASVEARNGSIVVTTTVQQGSEFIVRVPLAFAVAQVLLVRSGNSAAAVPLKAVEQVVEAEGFGPADQILRYGGRDYPARLLADNFAGRGPNAKAAETRSALLLESGAENFAMVVDEVLKTEEIAIKPIGKPLDSIPGVLGAALLGTGEMVPVLDLSHFSKAVPHMQQVQSTLAPEEEILVLVVDDSPSVRHMTSKVIKSAGWNVVTAKDGAEALDLLKDGTMPNVILTDVEMPRMDGYELVSAVLRDERFCEIPVVFITSRVSEKHRERAAELGITEYLTKPFVESELVRTVERLAALPAAVI